MTELRFYRYVSNPALTPARVKRNRVYRRIQSWVFAALSWLEKGLYTDAHILVECSKDGSTHQEVIIRGPGYYIKDIERAKLGE